MQLNQFPHDLVDHRPVDANPAELPDAVAQDFAAKCHDLKGASGLSPKPANATGLTGMALVNVEYDLGEIFHAAAVRVNRLFTRPRLQSNVVELI